MLRQMQFITAAAILAAFPLTAHAWLRPHYEDADVVDRSELIVIGHLKPDSIVRVENNNPAEGNSWSHHATLVITQTLKGKTTETSLPVVIFYGLLPMTGPTGKVVIADTADEEGDVTSDATKDNIWFLRKRTGTHGDKPGTGNYGIVDPEDLQSLSLKEYFLTYLSPDTEAALKKLITTQPDIAIRATHYLDHMSIQRALNEKDQVKRVEQLLPYFSRRFTWGMKYDEISDALVAVGSDAAGPPLLKLFADPVHRDRREAIILIWARMRFAGCVDTLIELLNNNNQFWSIQKLESGWRTKDAESPLTQDRRTREDEVRMAIYALSQIGDSRAKPAIEATLACWKSSPLQDSQIVVNCETALRSMK